MKKFLTYIMRIVTRITDLILIGRLGTKLCGERNHLQNSNVATHFELLTTIGEENSDWSTVQQKKGRLAIQSSVLKCRPPQRQVIKPFLCIPEMLSSGVESSGGFSGSRVMSIRQAMMIRQ